MSLIIRIMQGALVDSSLQSRNDKFQIIQGDGLKGTILEIKKSMTIGREGDLKTHPLGQVISRLHCKLDSPLLGEWGVEHLGERSVSSVKREGRSIPLERGKKEKLEKGDVIVLGPQKNPFRLELLIE